MDSENSTNPGNILSENEFQGHPSEKYIFTHNLEPRHEKYDSEYIFWRV